MGQSLSKKLALARAVSEFGNSFRYVALGLAVLAVNNSASESAFAELLETLSVFIAGLLIPFFIDRFSKVRSLLITEIFAVLASLVLVYGAIGNDVRLLFFGAGVTVALAEYHTSLLRSITANLAGSSPREIFAGLNYLQFVMFIAGLLGGAFSSLTLNYFPIFFLLIVDALSFVISGALIIYFVYKDEKFAETERKKFGDAGPVFSIWNEWKEGAVASFGNPDIFRPILAQSVIGICYGLYSAGIFSLYKMSIGLSDVVVPMGIFANRVASLGATYWNSRVELGAHRKILLAIALMAIGYLAISVQTSLYVFLFTAVVSAGMSILAPLNNAIVSSGVDGDVRGRVESFRSLSITIGMLTGNGITFLLLEYFGIRSIFVAASALSLVSYFFYSRKVMNRY